MRYNDAMRRDSDMWSSWVILVRGNAELAHELLQDGQLLEELQHVATSGQHQAHWALLPVTLALQATAPEGPWC